MKQYIETINNPDLKNILSDLSVGNHASAFNSFMTSCYNGGFTSAYDEFMNFRNEVTSLSKTLTSKIVGTLNSADPEHIKIPESSALFVHINSSIRGMFQDLPFSLDMPIVEAHAHVIDFMRQAIDGIFLFTALLDKKHGNIRELISNEIHLKIYDAIAKPLFGLVAGVGAGSWGPGEVGLALLGAPISKALKGDLCVGDRIIELKASRDPTSGGRLNVGHLKRGFDSKEEYIELIENLAVKSGKTFHDFLAYNIKKSKETKYLKSLNTFSTMTINQLNKHYFKETACREEAKSFLYNIFKLVINPNGHHYIKDKYIDMMVTESGELTYAGFQVGFMQLLYSMYSHDDGVDTIMVMNPDTGNFIVIDDEDDLEKAILNKMVLVTGGIDFADKQSKASPQIGIL